MDESELKERMERYATEVIMSIGRITGKYFPDIFSEVEEGESVIEVEEEPQADISLEDEETTESDEPQMQEVQDPPKIPVDEDRPEEE